MYRVVIDPRRRWRWDLQGGEYVEDAAGDTDAPWYAEVAEALVAHRPAAAVRFPPRCPHCDGVTTTKRMMTATRTRRPGFIGARGEDGAIAEVRVPACAKMPRPLPAYFLQLVLLFVTVAATLAIMATPYAAIIAVAGVIANLALYRARTWLELAPVVDDVLVFSVRDAAYAHALARLNHGRIEGKQPPALADGDEFRAPLPEARVKK